MKRESIIVILSALMLLTGCGGSQKSNSYNSNIQKEILGYYVDSAVVGAEYVCGDIRGVTGREGEFKFHKGDSCQFLVGGVQLREVESSKLYEGVVVQETNLSVARLLQTLDRDGNATKESIVLADKSSTCVETVFNGAIEEVNDSTIEALYSCLKSEDSSYDGKAVTEDEAKKHLQRDRNRTISGENNITNGSEEINGLNTHRDREDGADVNRTNAHTDTTPPTITLNGDNPTILEIGSNFTDPKANAVDDKDGNLSVVVDGEVDAFTLGEYTLTYTAKDSAGNEASVSRVVRVVDRLVEAEGVDIAHAFGKATQGTDISYTYYQPASYAIDNNDSTYNNTDSGEDGNNWLQIELPHPTEISKIVIQHRDKFYSRLKDAKVYISDTPYSGSLEDKTYIETLEPVKEEQVIEFSTPKRGSYLLIKGESISGKKKNLQLVKVEVYGATPVAPAFSSNNYSSLIPFKSAVDTRVGHVDAVDYQGSLITYSITDNVPFRVDAEGNIIVTQTLQSGLYEFEVEASDGTYRTRTSVTVEVAPKNALEELLKSGNIIDSKVTEKELIEATLEEIEASKSFMKEAKVKIFNLNSDGTEKSDASSLTSIDWAMTRNGGIFLPTLSENSTLLYSNAVEEGSNKVVEHLPMAILGSNYIVFGGNPFVNSTNEQMQKVLENTIAWITKRDDLKSNPLKVVIAQLKKDKGERAWLDAHYENVTYNTEKSCDGVALKGCLEEHPDLLIISQVTQDDNNIPAITSAVKSALASGVGVVYIHTPSGLLRPLGKALSSSVFNVKYDANNFAHRQEIRGYAPTQDLEILAHELVKVKEMFRHFKDEDYAFDWSRCKDNDGIYDKNYDHCQEVVGLSDFEESLLKSKEIVDRFDSDKIDIFAGDDRFRLEKLLVLTADKIRQTIHYPMDKVIADNNVFMKALYADSVVYNFRKINPVQPDLGNFSGTDFSTVTPTIKVVNMKSKVPFKATGAYALPAQTFKVTRNDNSDLVVKVFINTLRPSATHEYEKSGYSRPKNLQSIHFELKSGESVELTSPYGGPIELEFSKNDLDVSVTFENVGEHPYWESSADNESFTQKLNEGVYNWAEIVTESFEVHSRLDKMRESIANSRFGESAGDLAEAIQKYTSNYPYVLAGFKGDGVDVVPEIYDWATQRNMTIKRVDFVKHMNSDQATCGKGCSGNPYDAYWAFDPIGHGDLHEIGHSLQKMRFEGFPNHSATNTFSYYTKLRYFENTGEYGDCQGLPFKELFDTIQSSVGESNVTAYLQKNLWKRAGLGEQYLLKIEAMMHAQKLGKVQRGWHVLARVHILEREMKRAKEDWEARKASVGFSTYSLDEIEAISNNDWLTIAYSYASELDLRDYFDMMGIPFSQKAHDQIASFGFDKAPKSLFVSTDTGYCQSDEYGTLFDRPTLPIDGSTSYAY